jgi:electron-transferring-flavoprotein dehydrogenase
MEAIEDSALNTIDVLFVGAGPASLAGAIRLKQLLNENGRNESIVVIEKAEKLGQHNLSGALFEAEVLDELIPDWRKNESRFIKKMLANEVKKDEVFFLLPKLPIKVPELFIPPYMRHSGNYAISVSELVNWLAGHARSLGVEIYNGFVGEKVIVENGTVTGIKLDDKGLDKDKKPQSNYIPGETLKAKVTVFGDGSLGVLSEQLIQKLNFTDDTNPPIYSIGVKEVIKLPKYNNLGSNYAAYMLGFPNKASNFGGATIYSMGKDVASLAIYISLDWRYCDLDPQRELQLLKSHWFVKRLLYGGEVIAYGAKTLPEGGYYSMPEPVANGALIIGDAANLLSTKKLKGLHYAIESGILAANAVFEAIQKQDFSAHTLSKYKSSLEDSFVGKELREARNYRQIFSKAGRFGVYLGTPLSLLHKFVPGKLTTESDYKHTTKAKLNRQYQGGIDKLTDVSLSGTHHREDAPSHITLLNPQLCLTCGEEYRCHPCEFFCPGQVYRFAEGKMLLSPSNCLHCQTCRVKCPYQNIQWRIPEGGDGPKYKMM